MHDDKLTFLATKADVDAAVKAQPAAGAAAR